MRTYAEFQPSGFDTKGLGLPDRQDWLVAPVTVNRDSDCLTRSNWEVVTESFRLNPEASDEDEFEVHRFGHWACGWFEVCLVKPGTSTARMAEDWESALADYPVASEDHFSDLEHREISDSWAQMSLRERRSECERAGVSKLVAYRSSNLPDRLWERLRDGM